MPGKIFYRQRRKVKEGDRKPRFRLVAVAGVDLTVYLDHFRLQELEQLAAATEAELVFLEAGAKRDDGDEK